MAKVKAGLPDSFKLKVSASELADGPAVLPGYLDDKPNYFKSVEEAKEAPVILDIDQPSPIETDRSLVVHEHRITAPLQVVEAQSAKPAPEKIRRMQINITPDVERKVEELLELLGRQSPNGRVTVSELMQALVLNLYDARDNINGRLPQRGRWGTVTAKSYAAELALVLREAILKNWSGKAADPFKRAVGQ